MDNLHYKAFPVVGEYILSQSCQNKQDYNSETSFFILTPPSLLDVQDSLNYTLR